MLRVEVKKLKAFVSLLQQGTRHQIQVKGLKKLYKQAGVIRTVEINRKILQELSLAYKEFEEKQQQSLKEASTTFCQNESHYQDNIHRLQNNLEQSINHIKSEKVATFFQQGIEKLSLFFSAASMDAEALHSARKEVKNLMYLHALLPASLAASLRLNTSYLDSLQSKLGDWHDKMVTLSLLETMDNTDALRLQQLKASCAEALHEIRELACGFEQKVRSDSAKTIPSPLNGKPEPKQDETLTNP